EVARPSPAYAADATVVLDEAATARVRRPSTRTYRLARCRPRTLQVLTSRSGGPRARLLTSVSCAARWTSSSEPSLNVTPSLPFFSRRFDEAVPRLRVAIEDMPAFLTAYRYLAACYAHKGRLDDAHAAANGCGALLSSPVRRTSYAPSFTIGCRCYSALRRGP